MTAIPKAIAMANPKAVVACVATVAGVISSKLGIDAAASRMDGDGSDKIIPFNRPLYGINEEAHPYKRYAEKEKCMDEYSFCEDKPEECEAQYKLCLQAI